MEGTRLGQAITEYLEARLGRRITYELVQAILANGRLLIKGYEVPVSGEMAVAAGQYVAVAWEGKRPILAFLGTALKAQFPLDPALPSAAGEVVEVLYLLRNNPTTGKWKLLFRNDLQMVELTGLQDSLPTADLSIPTFVKWGNLDNHFFVGGGFNASIVRVVHVFKLNREPQAVLGATPAKATYVKSITLPNVAVTDYPSLAQVPNQANAFLNRDLTLSLILNTAFSLVAPDLRVTTVVITAGVVVWSSEYLSTLVATYPNPGSGAREYLVTSLGGYWEQSDLAKSYVFLSWGVTNDDGDQGRLDQWGNGLAWETGQHQVTLGPSSFDPPYGGPGDGIHTFQTVVASASREWALYLIGKAASGAVNQPPSSLIAYMRNMDTGVVRAVSADYGLQSGVFRAPHLHAGLYRFLTGGNWFYATDNRAAFMSRGIGGSAVNEVVASALVFTKTTVSDPTDTAQLQAAERGHLIKFLGGSTPTVQLVLGTALPTLSTPPATLAKIPAALQPSVDTLNASSDVPPHYHIVSPK